MKNLPPFSRRQCVQALGGGLGSIALAGMMPAETAAAEVAPSQTHFAPRAKRVIQLFMNGGPFQADLFDPKPALNKFAGQRPAEVQLRTERETAGLMAVPFKFQNCGEGGLPICELLPNLQQRADDLCVIRSCHTDNPNHGPALFLMNNGTMAPIRPSMGAWFTYGLGTENSDLPGYVVLCPGRPVRFAELWTSGFLPGEHQGLYINSSQIDPATMIPNVRHKLAPADQQRQLSLLQQLNEQHADERGGDARFDARIRSMETAYRMQFAATDAFDINRESAATRAQYGKSHYANACLLARRLVERGVRFVQVYYGNGQPWDTHNNHNEQVRRLCKDIDQPTASLLADLKQRGLLEDTLVVWGGEFGRTSTSEAGDGRDHNHYGFTMWLAGGGVRGGYAHGATDDFGFRAVDDKVHIHDLHATVLHLLGLDHERLVYRHAGRDFRLTDVHGRVVHAVIA
ncbi:DUF1501 domain-containing protein [Anatilimnocola floriformis]|uniref:DUF1501 domain-containing protein n=1 Tax=Anatilimnocola floriformis TaxID=2948575 RepID=UPI0020C5604E|nr:DUF1501 domain-containing protein [Anatilimnocola floriformis]